MTKKEIIEKIKQGIPSAGLIDKAMAILEKNPPENNLAYSHSLRVALSLKEMGLGENTITAGILHHLSEQPDLLTSLPEKNQEEVAKILRKIRRLKEFYKVKKDPSPRPIKIKKWQKFFLSEEAENVRKMFFTTMQDLRPIFIALAGCLDNMKTLKCFTKEEQRKKCLETLEIFSPLAYGLGMGEIKGQLEDLAFPELYAKEYDWLLKNIKDKYTERKEHLKEIKPVLIKMLEKEKIKVLDIHARAKHYFSLYQKLLRHDMDIEKIYDLVALRVIVPDVSSCYQTLGVIHKNWRPLSNRIKDYISSPKPNGYRSLHTTVVCPACGRRNIEIQIKTPAMYKEAEYGAAAHLDYKGEIPEKARHQHFYWIEKLRQWQEEIKDSKRMSEHLESELFKDQIFLFTPKGEVINLTAGSTPIDFAYAVHTAIGDHCSGAKVNGKMVSLNHALENGQTIEILTDKNKSPSSDWLRFVKTNKARSKIRHFLESALGMPLTKTGKKPFIKETLPLIKKILPLGKKKEPQVLIGGETEIAIKLSHCCSPKSGDNITGFITKGEGASVHKVNCQNLKYLKQKWPQRIVKATWNKNSS